MGRQLNMYEQAGVWWWDSLTERQRAYWLKQAGTAIAAEAYDEYVRVTSETLEMLDSALGGGDAE
jgi:hypothetical protein